MRAKSGNQNERNCRVLEEVHAKKSLQIQRSKQREKERDRERERERKEERGIKENNKISPFLSFFLLHNKIYHIKVLIKVPIVILDK